MRLGIPHPRLTYAPSGNSNAVRCAICSRVNRGFAMPSASITFFSLPLSGIPIFTMALSGIAEPFRLHDAMNEDRGSHDVFRIDGADRNDFFDFSDSRLGGHGHDGIEISCRQPIGQISQLIAGHVPKEITVYFHSENGILGMGPRAKPGEEDFDLVDAMKVPVTLIPGASFFHQADAHLMTRGGHLDVAVLGGFQVSEKGDLANWKIPGAKGPGGIGGAMDIAA